MELALAIVGGLTALIVLFTAYVNYKKEKAKKQAEDRPQQQKKRKNAMPRNVMIRQT